MKTITRSEALDAVYRTVGLSRHDDSHLPQPELLAALVRRTAGYCAPCAPATVIRKVKEACDGLFNLTPDQLSEELTTWIEKLIAFGDLLELHQVRDGDVGAASTWVYLAPPTFILVPEIGQIFLCGLSSELSLPLTESIKAHVSYQGFKRTLPIGCFERPSTDLAAMGWRELKIDAWLQQPKAETADDFVSRIGMQVDNSSTPSVIPDLKIAVPRRRGQTYRARWVTPTDETGLFVGRRPQQYGADLWCCLRLNGGTPTGLVDFPGVNSKERGCDVGWRALLAMDCLAGNSQTFLSLREGDRYRLDFFSPLPAWALRRLSVLGEVVASVDCLLSIVFIAQEVEEASSFLQDRLWMRKQSEP